MSIPSHSILAQAIFLCCCEEENYSIYTRLSQEKSNEIDKKNFYMIVYFYYLHYNSSI